MLRSFWQNLGMTYNDIEKLPLYTTEMLTEIMNLEDSFQNREIRTKSTNTHGKNNSNRIKSRG